MIIEAEPDIDETRYGYCTFCECEQIVALFDFGIDDGHVLGVHVDLMDCCAVCGEVVG
jgi:hypothetical protein